MKNNDLITCEYTKAVRAVIDCPNLYFTSQEDSLLDDNNIWVEVLSDLPESRRYSF